MSNETELDPSEWNPTIAQVIGKNVHDLRGDFTMENLATQARALGVQWSSGSVGSIETGRFKPTVDTLIVLSLTLGRLRGTGPVSIAQLLQAAPFTIALPGDLMIHDSDVLEWLRGGELTVQRHTQVQRTYNVDGLGLAGFRPLDAPELSTEGAITPGEERLAKKAEIHVDELRSWALKLWGKPFEQRRDEIAGAGATPQKKGRVTRQLLEEIHTAMKENNGND